MKRTRGVRGRRSAIINNIPSGNDSNQASSTTRVSNFLEAENNVPLNLTCCKSSGPVPSIVSRSTLSWMLFFSHLKYGVCLCRKLIVMLLEQGHLELGMLLSVEETKAFIGMIIIMGISYT